MSLLNPGPASEVPKELKPLVRALKRTRGKEACIRKVHSILTARYHGCRLYTYTHFLDFFRRDIIRIWRHSGCLHCTLFNYLAKTLLVHSGKFTEGDIKSGWTLIYYFSPHQYLKVRTGPHHFTELDIWGANYGVKIGEHARPLLTSGNFFKRSK